MRSQKKSGKRKQNKSQNFCRFSNCSVRKNYDRPEFLLCQKIYLHTFFGGLLDCPSVGFYFTLRIVVLGLNLIFYPLQSLRKKLTQKKIIQNDILVQTVGSSVVENETIQSWHDVIFTRVRDKYYNEIRDGGCTSFKFRWCSWLYMWGRSRNSQCSLTATFYDHEVAQFDSRIYI